MNLQTIGSERVRYRNKLWMGWVFYSLMVFFVAFDTWLVGTGLRYGFSASLRFDARVTALFSLGLGLLMLPVALLVPVAVLQAPVIFTPESLLIRRGFRRVSIPVPDIAGVGLVFKRSNLAWPGSNRVPSQWQLMVWRSDGRSEPAAITYAPVPSRTSDAGSRKRRNLRPAKFDPVGGTDTGQLAETHAGRVARDIYDRVLSCQGPSGPLAVGQLQEHVHGGGAFEPAPIVAYWSPNGIICRAEDDHSRSDRPTISPAG